MSDHNYSKENIKTRMYSRITALWDIRGIEDLDPMVKLLVEALASEIFSLSGELDGIEDRVVQKLAGTFTPSHMMSASPAHAVLHARAVSGSILVDKNLEFTYKNPHFLQKHNLRKLALTPVCRTTLFEADVTSMIAGGRFYDIAPKGGKDHIGNSTGRSPVFNNSVWIGLDIGEEVHSLNYMPFYFTFPFMDNAEYYLRLLGHGKWSHGNTEIQTVSGLVDSIATSTDIFDPDDQRIYLQNDIKGKYNSGFITIKDELGTRGLKRERIPKELLTLFNAEFTKGLRDDLVWLKVLFPPAFDDSGLNNLLVHTNCFPVANIYHKESLTQVTPLSSIVPLGKEDSEYFLFIDSVTDSAGNEYKQVRTHQDSKDARTYTVRRGGSERFSPLDAHDLLERLTDTFRDESIAFTGIDKDIERTATDMLEFLTGFDRKLSSYDGNTEHTSYIIPGDDIKERTNFAVRYRLTNGAIGNGIRGGETLLTSDVNDITPFSAILMTTTRGGRKAPPESARRAIYQYLLTSRDRIYTREDIRLFCCCHYGDCFTDIEIKNDYEISNKPKQGVVRTTDIHLYGTKEKSSIEPELLIGDILAGLRQCSPDGVNYRVILK